MANNSAAKFRHGPIDILRDIVHQRTKISGKDGVCSSERGPTQETPWTGSPLDLVVSKLRCPDHVIVIQAVEELRSRGVLTDGELSWACLRYANLQDADLSNANLRNADLEKANLELADLSNANLMNTRFIRAGLDSVNLDKAILEGANLVGASLRGARNVNNAQLARASRMRGAIMPDGSLYDGCYNLPGDFVDASILHVDLNNPEAIASFYGVTIEDFVSGQAWRQENLPSTSAWNENINFQNAEVVMRWL